MTTAFDFLSTAIFIAAAGHFFLRLRSDDPPLAPYVAVSLACAAGNWLGNEGLVLASLASLSGAATLLIATASVRNKGSG